MSIGLTVLLVIIGIVLAYCALEHFSSKSRADQIFDTWKQKSEVNPETRRRAIVIAGHDMERIERLLEIARRNNPERTEQWYWEKILYDMERDRGV
jgi:cytochrome c-type biogenesis protein CcmH/NrfG